MPAPNSIHHPFVYRPGQKIKPRPGIKRDYYNPWPYKIEAKFIKLGDQRGRGGKLIRYMRCPICGKWWERPVSANYGCSSRCQDAVLGYRRGIRIAWRDFR